MIYKIGQRGLFPTYFIITLFISLLIPAGPYGAEINKNAEKKSTGTAKYELLIENNLISLNAEDAFLKLLLEEIGQKMKIDVIVHIPKKDKITIRFENLSLEEALTKFKANYACVTNSKLKGGKITRIVVVPKGNEGRLSFQDTAESSLRPPKGLPIRAVSKQEPFKFEFDPSQF